MPSLPQIYIVDDEASVCTAYARLVRSANMEAWTFSSVEEFLATEVQDENACLICDVAMPGRSGLDLPPMLSEAGRNIQVIFVTAYDNPQTREVARHAGCVAYFSKPVDDDALLAAISRALIPLPKGTL